MWLRVARLSLSLVLVGALAACSEPSGPAGSQVFEFGIDPAGVTGPSDCDLILHLKSDAGAYFSEDDHSRETALSRVHEMHFACKEGKKARVAELAWEILELIESLLDEGNGGDPTTGSALVGGLLSCTETLCSSDGVPAIDFALPLSPSGLFAVRAGGAEPAVARGTVPFTDFFGNPNSALWGVEVDAPWSQVTHTPRVLIYGFPPPVPELPVNEVRMGGLEYELNVYPDLGEFLDGALHVAACFSSEVTLPHIDDDHAKPALAPLMQRQSVLLETYTGPGFCDPAGSTMQHASIFGSVMALARRIVIEPVRAFFMTDRGITHVGGTPLDFSRFAPVVVNGEGGGLELLAGPNSVVSAGESIGTIQVRAVTENGTPIEKVLVSLMIYNNRGVPAGAELSGGTESLTQERDGLQGVATFPDGDGGPVTVGKPGGYIICATGTFEEFTFEPVCSERFHVRNR